MSYLMVVIIGALVGFVAGQYLKGSEHPAFIDAIAGAAGACIAVFIIRMIVPDAGAGYVVGIVTALVAAVATLALMRKVMKEKPVPVTRRR